MRSVIFKVSFSFTTQENMSILKEKVFFFFSVLVIKDSKNLAMNVLIYSGGAFKIIL